MLYAFNAKSEWKSLYRMSSKAIQRAREESFYCPVCRSPLQIRAGTKMIPHFAHLPKSACELAKGGESEEHERGKWAIYKWLQHQGFNVKLEYYLERIKQRPDIWLEINNKRIAIEYQCAQIPIKNIIKRTASYRKEGIIPFWILGHKHFQRAGTHQVFLNEFTRTFLYHWSSSYHLFFFHPFNDSFVHLSHMRPGLGRFTFANIAIHSLKKLTLSHLLSTTESFQSQNKLYLSHWANQWNQNRTIYRKQVNSEERHYRQYLYLKGEHFSLIPSACFLPVKGQIHLGTKPYIWQTRLICDYFAPLPLGSPITFPTKDIIPTPNGYIPDLYHQYLSILAQLNIIEKTGKNIFIKNKEVNFHKRMEDALEDDRITLDCLKKIQEINK
jgi:competence protein CoiA